MKEECKLVVESSKVIDSLEFLNSALESRNPFNDLDGTKPEGLYIFECEKDYGKSYKIYQCMNGSVCNRQVWFEFPSIRVFLDRSVQSKMVSILILKKISNYIPEDSDLMLALNKINKAMDIDIIY